LPQTNRDFNTAISLRPDYVKAYNGRGLVNENLKRYDDAIRDFGKCLEIKPDYHKAYNNRSVSLLLLFYTVCLTMSNLTHRAIVFDDLGDHTRAIADYTKATELHPTYFYVRDIRLGKLPERLPLLFFLFFIHRRLTLTEP
jgi:tetratricopeptide (TPR) repeat protein